MRERQRTRDREHIVGTFIKRYEEQESEHKRVRERESEREQKSEKERGKTHRQSFVDTWEREREREPIVSRWWTRNDRE